MKTIYNGVDRSLAAAALEWEGIQQHGANLLVQFFANETASAMESRPHCFGTQA